MSLHIVDIITLVVTGLAHVYPLLAVDLSVVDLEIMFISTPATQIIIVNITR